MLVIVGGQAEKRRSGLTCVGSHVGFQMRALGVGFPAAGELAVVRGRAFSAPRLAASFLLDAARLFVRVELQQRRGGRREHHPLQGSGMLLLLLLSVHAVLSLKLRVLGRIGRAQVLVRHVMLTEVGVVVRMTVNLVGAHRVHLRQIAARASLVDGVRAEAVQRPLLVRKGTSRARGAHRFHKVPGSHHTRLDAGLGFDFVPERGGGHGSWGCEWIQSPQLGVLTAVSHLGRSVRRALLWVTQLGREQLRHQAAHRAGLGEAAVALHGQVAGSSSSS